MAVTLADILRDLLKNSPEHISITPEWICRCHQTLAGTLFPEWAGRFRDTDVWVGPHTPPRFYEVAGLVRLFSDDLTERLSHVRLRETPVVELADLLASVDWRFQWIHPFKDFNGRVGRILLAAVLYKLALPHVQTAPVDPDARSLYLEALRVADQGDLSRLSGVWVDRLTKAL